jgi:hypothetical protein
MILIVRGTDEVIGSIASAATHESGCGTFRTWSHVRFESAMRTKADVHRPLQNYGFTP